MIFLKNNSKYSTLNPCGFSMIEVMTAVVVLGAMAGIALPTYKRSLESERCRNAQRNLAAINQAATVYQLQMKDYNLSGTTLAAINTDLGLHIYDNSFTYTFAPGSSTFQARATRQGGNYGAYVCTVTQGMLTSTNPSCGNPEVCTPVITP